MRKALNKLASKSYSTCLALFAIFLVIILLTDVVILIKGAL